MSTRSTKRADKGDNADTESLIERVALTLLARDGVLSGINLREVADKAEVSRALVYHYYRSRRDLLRAALRRDVRDRTEQILSGAHLPLVKRARRFFRTMIKYQNPVQLKTILVLDGDADIVTMPLRNRAIEMYLEDVRAGHLAEDDLEALHLTLMALVNGYLVYRDHFAAEIGAKPHELDRRVEAILGKLLSGLTPQDPQASRTE